MRKLTDTLIIILAWLVGSISAILIIAEDLPHLLRDKKSRQRKFNKNEGLYYKLNFKPVNDRVIIDLEYLLNLDNGGVIRIKSPNRRIIKTAIQKGAWQKENDNILEVLIEDDSVKDIINRVQGSIIQQ